MKRLLVVAAVAASFAALAGSAAAAPVGALEGPNVSEEETKSGDAVAKTYALARELVDYGRINNDALALIVAASMRQQVKLTETDRKPETEGGAAGGLDETPALTVEAILDEARAMSGNDEAIVAMAGDVLASASKGRSFGPAYNVQTIPPSSTDNYRNIGFDGGDYAEVYTEGSGRTNLDLYVYDENGNLVCSDTGKSDISYCGWTPRWTGQFTIKVVNRGGKSNKYSLITN